MAFDSHRFAQFKAELDRARDSNHEAWVSSTKLVGHSSIADTLNRLTQAIRASDQSAALKELLLNSLSSGSAQTIQQLRGDELKRLTGLPTTKAVRALCLFFGVFGTAGNSATS
jgi:hypothetical protein